MKKRIIRTGLFVLQMMSLRVLHAQELFVFSEPASNMPAKSIGIRITQRIMPGGSVSQGSYQCLPEIMWGANRNLMVHVDGFFTNLGKNFHAVGGGLYAKYRIYSVDGINKHFRMAAFTRLSLNNAPIIQQEIDLSRNNTGYALGLIATQLLHKQAISASVRFDQAFNNGSENKIPENQSRQAISWSLSTGRLILPKHYSDFKQVNMNLMLESSGQYLAGTHRSFFDLGLALQFIFNSQTRVDIGYQFQVAGNMERVNANAWLLRFEHLLFNVF